jgi:hypothetical protein
MLLIIALLTLATAAPRDPTSLRYLFDVCANDAACRAMYQIGTGTSERLFEFLLRLRTNNTADSWQDVFKRHYNTGGEDALRRSWLHLMRSLTPHCMPCSDAISADVGVECVGDDRRLVYESANKRFRCAQNSSRVMRAQTADVSSTEDHVSSLSVVAVVMLASVLSLSACTTVVKNLYTVRKL